MVTHPEVADKIRACVDDQGGFKDGASPELRRARSQRATAEAKLRRALQSANGSAPPTRADGPRRHARRRPPVLVVGVAAGGGLVLIEPPSVVMLNGQLAQTIAAEETAIDAIRRKLTSRRAPRRWLISSRAWTRWPRWTSSPPGRGTPWRSTRAGPSS